MGRAYRLHLTRVNLNNTDACGNKFLTQGVCERANGCFSRAVDTPTLVWITAGDTANVDDIPSPTIRSGLEDGQNGLCHVDQASDIRVEHYGHIPRLDIGRLSHAFDQATVYTTS